MLISVVSSSASVQAQEQEEGKAALGAKGLVSQATAWTVKLPNGPSAPLTVKISPYTTVLQGSEPQYRDPYWLDMKLIQLLVEADPVLVTCEVSQPGQEPSAKSIKHNEVEWDEIQFPDPEDVVQHRIEDTKPMTVILETADYRCTITLRVRKDMVKDRGRYPNKLAMWVAGTVVEDVVVETKKQ
jgi:hypothetical protein